MAKTVKLPMKLNQFLEFTGWQGDNPRHRLSTALDYFQNTVDLEYLSKPVEDPKGADGLSISANPWILPRDNPIQVCLLMQAIDFSYPVSVVHITKGQILKAFQTIDWAMWRGVREEYRHGGGRQFYIWKPQTKLRLVCDWRGHLLLTSCHCLQLYDTRRYRPETGILSNSSSHRFLLWQ